MADIFDEISGTEKGDIFDTVSTASFPKIQKSSGSRRDVMGITGNAGNRKATVESARNATRSLGNMARPVLEGVGMVGGGLAGSVLGPVGTVGGGALGFGMGKNIADLMTGEDKPRSLVEVGQKVGRDLSTGAAYEMGGQVVGRVAGAALGGAAKVKRAISKSTPAISKKAVEAKAGQILEENTSGAPVYQQNAKDAANVAKEVEGLKVSAGEATNDHGLIKLQRGLERQPGEAADLMVQNKAKNQQALRDYLGKEFTGNESIDDVIAALQRKKAALENVTRNVSGIADEVTNSLTPVNTQESGRAVVGAIDDVGKPVKASVNEKYRLLPNDALPTSNTAETVKALKGEFRPGDETVYPSRAIQRIEEALKGPKPAKGEVQILDAQGKPFRETTDVVKSEVGFQDLHSLRKDIGRQIQDASTGMNPNRELAMKLQKLKSAIDADIEAGMGANSDYVQAREAFVDYANRFRTGTVEQITRRGNEASGLNIPDGLIVKKVFTPDGADDLIRAIGKDKAAIIIEGHAADDLLKRAVNPATGEINRKALAGWLNKNRQVLDKFGITDQFSRVDLAHAALESAKANESAFNKSIAAKLLDSDPEKAIAAAMGGAGGMSAKNTAGIMQGLIKQLGGDKKAIAGLKNAFKDFLVNKAETTAKTISGDNILSPAAIQKEMAKYRPAMHVLYKDEPRKLKALLNVQKAVEISARSSRSPLGGGSDTAENMNVAANVLGVIVERIPGLNLATRLGKMGLGAINNLNQKEVNNLVARALYDPDLALTLMRAASGKTPQKEVARQLNSHLITLGIYAMTPEGDTE